MACAYYYVIKWFSSCTVCKFHQLGNVKFLFKLLFFDTKTRVENEKMKIEKLIFAH